MRERLRAKQAGPTSREPARAGFFSKTTSSFAIFIPTLSALFLPTVVSRQGPRSIRLYNGAVLGTPAHDGTAPGSAA